MTWKPQKYSLHLIVLLILLDITYSHDNDTSTEGQRHGRVSGRIVKLYSGPKPDPILCLSEGFLADTIDCSVFYRCLKASNGKYTVYRFQCGPGTVYDPETEVCNHPRSTKRLECGGLSSNKQISSTERYIENEIVGLHEVNQELPSPISTKPPKVSNSLLSSIATAMPVKFESSYVTNTYPWVSIPKEVNGDSNTASSVSPWNIPAVVSTKKPWDYTPAQTTYSITREPSLQNGVQCTSDGFIGDNEDCRKFYRCVNNQRGGYIRYEFSCSDSTIWDDDTQGCNHAWAVQRRRCGKGNNFDENSISYIEQITNNDVIQNNIIQQQSQVSYGSKLTHTQKESTTGSTIQNQTQFSYGTPSQSQLSYIHEVTEAEPHQSDQIKISVNISSSMTNATTIPNNKRSTYNKCTKTGFMGDSDDCKKFYRCVSNEKGGFTMYEFSCNEGTLWDDQLETCNHAWAVKECGGKKSNQNKSPVTTIIESTTFKYYTTASSSFDSNEIGYADQNNQQELEQPSPSTTTQTTLLTTTIQSFKPYETTDCKSSGFFGNINDCVKFYRCVESGEGKFTKYEYKCGDGTVWDPEIESCNHAWSVKSCGTYKINSTQTENNAVQSNEENNIITTVSLIQTTTQKNIPDFVSGIYSEKDDSYNTNELYDNDSKYTVKTTTLSLTTNNVTPATNKANECQSDGFMSNDHDCKVFYRCVENGNGGFIRYEFSCGDGTVWDPTIAACNHVWAVEKCGGTNSAHDNVSPTEHTKITAISSSLNEISTRPTTLSSNPIILTSTVSNNDCIVEGFIGDKQDCKKFYRCVENGKGAYTRYEFTCGEGTVWDRNIQACNHAWAVKSCGSNESSNSESTLTTHPTTMKDEQTNNNLVTQNNQEIISSTENNLVSSSTIKSSTTISTSKECNTDGFTGDNYDCKKFYRCVNDGKGSFIRYEFSCGEGTVWDSEINACNHVNSVKTTCSSMTTQTIQEKEPNYVVSSTSSEANHYSTTSKEPPQSQQCEQEGFFGDKIDCKKFYRCTDNGQEGFHKYEFTCGEGTIWDQEILACNHASSNLHCGSSDKESQTDNINIQSTTSITQATEKMPTSSSSDECFSEGFYANSNDCKRFFRCVGNGKGGFTRYDFTCGEGTIWVQDIQACDHDSDTSLCSKGTITSTTGPPSHSSQEKPIAIIISTSTAKSTTIHRSTPTPSTKPALQDETASELSSTAETSFTASTTASATHRDRCEEAGYFGNSNDCKMFYRCVDDGKGGFTKYDFTCGDGTIWDQDITACNHPQDVTSPSCKNVGSTSTTVTTTTMTSTTMATTISKDTAEPTKGTSSTQPSTTQNSNQSTQNASTNKPNSANYTCNEAGFYADPYDCKKFYRCVDWGGDGKTFSIYHFDCGEGTIWDPKLQTCNHEESVYPPRDCSGTQSQTEHTNDTSTTAKQEETTETTSEASTTTMRSTTQKATTESSTTTTELSSTSDQTSTQQSSTAVQTTSTQEGSTQPSTIEQTTTQKSTTEQSTTQQSTTAQSSTQQSTTEQSTTQQSTMAQSSTQQSTTEQGTTQQLTTAQSSTQQSTTEQSTTQQSTTAQSSTQQSTTEQSTTQQSTTEQSTTQQSTTEQSTTQQSTTDQSTTPQSTSTSSTTQQSTTEQTTTSTTTEQTVTTSSEENSTTVQTSESTTSGTDQTTKAEQSTTQQSTEQTSENQSSTTEQSTTQETTDGSSTTESGQDTTTEQESSDKMCPQTDNDQYLFVCPTGFKRHPKYCNLFYQCTEDDDTHEMKVAVFNCPNNTIYDESKTQCIEEGKADKKCEGQIAQKRRVKRLDGNYREPITVGKEKYLCPGVGHFPFEKHEQCSPVLFKCKLSKSGKLRGFLYQCPEGYVYWSISRRCERASIMTDCKRTSSYWNGRYEIPIEKSNVSRKTIR